MIKKKKDTKNCIQVLKLEHIVIIGITLLIQERINQETKINCRRHKRNEGL